jgi:SAM-dependent MidA family methyltransferase
VSLEQFVDAALYAPEIGYYTKPETHRVGSAADRDFYTASSLGAVFARLVASAVQSLWPSAFGEEFTFVELGAEPERHLFSEFSCPFPAHRVIRQGEPVQLSGPCVVFSNELFDAQPFRQFRFVHGFWQEVGVRIDSEAPSLEARAPANPLPTLPTQASEGYCLDDPSGARRLMGTLTSQPWHGLFLAFDYGLSREEIHHRRPDGTARTYHHHRMGTDLLEAPGEIDLTHHICWDDLLENLRARAFPDPLLQSQESFFMHHAAPAIEEIITTGAGTFDPARQVLKSLLHPENMGRKFQVLHAVRSVSAPGPAPI